MPIVSVLNEKGGVGKTTLCFNLAHHLAREGKAVLLIDNDAQGNLTRMCGVETTARTAKFYAREFVKPGKVVDNLYLYAGGRDLKPHSLGASGVREFAEVVTKIEASGKFDLILIDCNPALTNLTFAALAAAAFVLIPIQPSDLSLDGMENLFEEIKAAKAGGTSAARPIGFVQTMVTKTALHRHMGKTIMDTYPKLLFETKIPRLVAFEESAVLHKPVHEIDANGNAELAIAGVARELMSRLAKEEK